MSIPPPSKDDRALEDKMQALLSALSAASSEGKSPLSLSQEEDEGTILMREEMAKWKKAHPEDDDDEDVVKIEVIKKKKASSSDEGSKEEETLDGLLTQYMSQIKAAREASGTGHAPIEVLGSTTASTTTQKGHDDGGGAVVANYDDMSLEELVAQLDNFNADGTPIAPS